MKALLIALVCFVLLGCRQHNDSEAESKPTGPIIKISVLQSGRILIDGADCTITQVEQRLTRLKSEGGTVWYYREAAQEESPAEAMQVIKLVVDNGLPISLSTRPDFSDCVEEDGQPHPRE